MKSNIKLTLISIIMYLAIAIGAVIVSGYTHGNLTSELFNSQVRQNAPVQAENTQVLIGEFIAILIIGAVEVRFKLLRKGLFHMQRFINWMLAHKGRALLYRSLIQIGIFALWFQILGWYALIVNAMSLIPMRYYKKVFDDALIPVAFIGFPLFFLFGTITSIEMAAIISLVAIVITVATKMKYGTRIWWVNILVTFASFIQALFFGQMFSPTAIVIILAALALYDFLAVFYTKHMQLLAKTLVKQRMPVAFILGKQEVIDRTLSGNALPEDRGKASMLGAGDIIFPGAVIASFILSGATGVGLMLVAAASVGMTINMALLQTGKFKQGLPAIPMIAIVMGITLVI